MFDNLCLNCVQAYTYFCETIFTVSRNDRVFLRVAGVLGVPPGGAGADAGGCGVPRQGVGEEAVDW